MRVVQKKQTQYEVTNMMTRTTRPALVLDGQQLRIERPMTSRGQISYVTIGINFLGKPV